MQEDFTRIMVLIDFSEPSLHAADEAAMLAAKFNSELYLVHVSLQRSIPYLLTPEAYAVHLVEDVKKNANEHTALLKIKTALENNYSIKVNIQSAGNNIKQPINALVQNNHIDLLVIGVKRKKGILEYFFGSKEGSVIDSVNCEVLCVYPGSDCSSLKKIVIPVGKFIPKRKIRLAYKLARKFAANIHLVGFAKNSADEKDGNSKMLMAAYQYIKDMTNIPVVCKTVPGNNLAKSVIQYSKKIDADLILVNPGTESQIQGPVLRRRISDIVNYSSIPVLSVQAIANNE